MREETMRKGWIFGGMTAAALLLLAYAWIDGGREPVRPIVESVAVPEISE